MVDLEGGLAMGLGSFALRGELELLLGCELDFNNSVECERFRSRSLKNLGKDGLFAPSLAAFWSLPLAKLISHAWEWDDDLVSSCSSLFRVPGLRFPCSNSTVNDRFLDILDILAETTVPLPQQASTK